MPDFTIFLHYISYWQTQTLHNSNTRIKPSHYILTSQIKPFTTATLEQIHLSCHKYQRQHLKHKQRSDNWIKISQRETAALITEERSERPRFPLPDFPSITRIILAAKIPDQSLTQNKEREWHILGGLERQRQGSGKPFYLNLWENLDKIDLTQSERTEHWKEKHKGSSTTSGLRYHTLLHITTTAVDIIRDHSAESSTKTSDKRVLSIHQQWTPTSLAIKAIYTFQDHNFQHQFSTSSTRTINKTWLQHQPLAKSIAHPRNQSIWNIKTKALLQTTNNFQAFPHTLISTSWHGKYR